MRKHSDNEAAIKRLKRIEGQIRGIINMIGDGKGCEDILIQIGSAKAALHKAGQIILENHLSHCLLDGIREGKGEEAIEKLLPAIEQFSRIV